MKIYSGQLRTTVAGAWVFLRAGSSDWESILVNRMP